MLHLSATRKSTYHDVIRYGTGFKARVRHPSGVGEIELPSGFKTAEAGALARYHYYLQNESLCYGVAEDEIIYYRKKLATPDEGRLNDAELWPRVVQQLQDAMRYEKVLARGQPYFVPGPRGPQLEAHRSNVPVIDTSPLAATQRFVLQRELGIEPDGEPGEPDKTTVELVDKPSWTPTWSALGPAGDAEAPKRGRPRVHYEAGDGCACGRKWPCPRRQKSDD